MEKLDDKVSYPDWLSINDKPLLICYSFSDGSAVSYDTATATTLKVEATVTLAVE